MIHSPTCRSSPPNQDDTKTPASCAPYDIRLGALLARTPGTYYDSVHCKCLVAHSVAQAKSWPTCPNDESHGCDETQSKNVESKQSLIHWLHGHLQDFKRDLCAIILVIVEYSWR